MSRFITTIQVALLITLTAAYAYTSKPPDPCSLRVVPIVSIAPLTYIRIQAVVEPNDTWRSADLTLYDDVSALRRSTVFEGDPPFRRTTQIEWKSLYLDEGTYVIHLHVSGVNTQCSAKVSLDVH